MSADAGRRQTPMNASGWGVACWRCGHPATYHGSTFCASQVGAGSRKRDCDCIGYTPCEPTPNASGVTP